MNNVVRFGVLVGSVVCYVCFVGLLCLPARCMSVVHFETDQYSEYLLSVRKMYSVLGILMG